jgi:hypothetical protein
MTARYVMGPAYVVVRGGAVVLLPEKVTPELVDELWTVLGERSGVVAVLEVLTGAFGASLASLPPFAMAVTEGRRVQVAARGGASVTIAREDGREHVAGDGVTTWAERTFDDVVDLAVQVGVTESREDLVDVRGLPLGDGVVLAASVGVRLTESAAPAAATPRPEPATEPWEAEPRHRPASSASSVSPASAASPAAGDVTAAPAPLPPSDAPVSGVPFGAVDTEATIAPESTFHPAAALAESSPAEAEGSPAGVRDEDAALPAAPEPAPSADAPEETTGFGHLWGSTVLRGVEDAAVRPPEEDEEEDVAATPPPPAPVTSAPAPAPAAPSVEDEIDGSTVLSSAIADLRAAVPASDALPAAGAGAPAPRADAVPPGPAFAATPAPTRPTILARECPLGHPNPPQRDACATCGQPLHGEARQVPRPSLGVLAVSDGPRVVLDRPVVVGRRPRSPRVTGDDLPRLVTVPSPQQDISRSHLEVRLEGWHVLVGDMNTTNGTTLLRSGQPPLRLHPGEPALVVAGDVVDLGDGVTLTFEGIL